MPGGPELSGGVPLEIPGGVPDVVAAAMQRWSKTEGSAPRGCSLSRGSRGSHRTPAHPAEDPLTLSS